MHCFHSLVSHCCSNTDKMAKLSYEDKMRIQTLREQGLGAKAICKAYPEKAWAISTISKICKRVDNCGSAVERKIGSGQPRTVRTAETIEKVAEMLCSQDDQPGTGQSTRQVARQLQISRSSIQRIAKNDLKLKSFKRIGVQLLSDSMKAKRLERCRALLTRLTQAKCMRVFFTDEKVFYLDPPVSSQNNRLWSANRKKDICPQRLLHQRAKFSRHVMVSAGVCGNGRGRLHFVAEKAKVNAEYYTTALLPELMNDCHNLLGNDFTFQQDGAPAHTARQAQQFLENECPDLIGKDQWPPNSPDLNPLDYCVWGIMLDRYNKLNPKPTTLSELKVALQNIWDSLPDAPITKAIRSFRKRLQSCVRAEGGHFEHLLK